MAHARSAQTPVVVNVADLLKQLQSATFQTLPPQNVVVSGQGPVVTQHNSVMLGGASSSSPSQNALGDVSYCNSSYSGSYVMNIVFLLQCIILYVGNGIWNARDICNFWGCLTDYAPVNVMPHHPYMGG